MGLNYSTTDLRTYTIAERLQHWAKFAPDRELVVFYSGKCRDVYTAKKLLEIAGKFANRLRHQYGFKRYDVIANTLPNSPERLITDLGIVLAGCVAMNGQILLADGDDFLQSAKTSRCRGVVLRPSDDVPAWRLLKPYVRGDCRSDKADLSCERAPEMATALLVSRHSEGNRKPLMEDLKTSCEDIFVEHDVLPQDLGAIFTTSGSTGYSKLVPRTQTELFEMWNAVNKRILEFFNPKSGGAYYNDRPFGWIGGYPFGTYLNGDKRVLLDGFDAHGHRKGEDMWNVICQEKCTHSIMLPLDIDAIVKYVVSLGVPAHKLKMLCVGGQSLRKVQLEAMFMITDMAVIAYGSTEGGFTTMTAIKDADDLEHFLVGKPFEGITVRIVDDMGNDCKPGKIGSVLVKGTGVFKGYFNRLEDPDPKTAAAFTDEGWFCTEDNGFTDEEGNCYVIGRHKDIISYGGSVLYPAWLEDKILSHPDVSEASVVPVTDPVLFHNICACVKSVSGSGLTEDILRAHCESIFVADTDNEGTPMPHYFLILENFPRTPTGKVDKVALRKLAEETFGLKEDDQ